MSTDWDGRPIYAEEQSSSDTWEREALRSQQWADEARLAARRYHRRQAIFGWLLIALAFSLIVAVVIFVAYAIAQSTQ